VPGDFICRTRYIDGLLTAALNDSFFPERVVTLGAGYDTRACRLNGALPGQLRYVEVDHPATQARKVLVVRQFLSQELLERTVWVSHDLASLPETSLALKTALGENARTFWIAEGLFSYLPRESVQRLLAWIGETSTPGSQVVFTYVERELVERRASDAAARSILRYLDEAGERFLSGWAPAEMALDCRNAGLEIQEDLSEADLYARYLAPLGRKLGVVKQFRIVAARVPQP
jgi:methyltransferase (TIGR00027 family)